MNREKSIQLLNEAAADELWAVHQYMYFHFHLDDLGFGPLAMLFKRTAIEEMMHIELLAERILQADGQARDDPGRRTLAERDADRAATSEAGVEPAGADGRETVAARPELQRAGERVRQMREQGRRIAGAGRDALGPVVGGRRPDEGIGGRHDLGVGAPEAEAAARDCAAHLRFSASP